MPKVSVNILTKNRASLLEKALSSVAAQSYKDYEVVLVNDGSTDETLSVIEKFKSSMPIKVLNHAQSLGIISSRQEALEQSAGEYIVVLDDDDQWSDPEKLKKQVDHLDQHLEIVLVGGAIQTSKRPETDGQIRSSMLLRNNFFTSTVMFRKEVAIKAGGFVKDGVDLCEDYDLWLRMGKLGKMYNFQEVFTQYTQPSYNREKFKSFLHKQFLLITKYKNDYPGYVLASIILEIRLLF